ncbi:MAG: FGGY family carbohydrate kinase, partial [Bacteroidota bacterium]
MAARYVLGVDQGTTSSRAILFDGAGRAVKEAKRPHRTICPHPGWVENDPLEIRDNVLACLEEVLTTGVEPGDVAALGITNQRETAIVWERATGRPVYNAISWQDSRTAEACQRLQNEGLARLVREKTGLALFPYFSATKLQWILENVPGVRARAEADELLFGTIDTWLIWWLTGGPDGGRHVTDPSNASRTMLLNLRTLTWDDDLLKLFSVPRALLPEVVPSSSPVAYGTVSLGGGRFVLPLAADVGDQQSALVGQGCFDPGEVKNSFGTANAILMNTGS